MKSFTANTDMIFSFGEVETKLLINCPTSLNLHSLILNTGKYMKLPCDVKSSTVSKVETSLRNIIESFSLTAFVLALAYDLGLSRFK